MRPPPPSPFPKAHRPKKPVKLAVWKADSQQGLTHFLSLSSDLAEDRELLRSCGISARHWVRKPQRTALPSPPKNPLPPGCDRVRASRGSAE